ncbi:MAG: ATP-binding cassette domain-containing protein [Butyrivibrio sp.]|nr:ATP-binding cassette domain-containing protein [Butyrivibrio sp.]
MERYIITTEHLTKKHGEDYRIRNVNLHIPQGEIYGFLGPNGAGKTTTLKLLLGLIRSDSGTISICGQPLTKRNHLQSLRDIGSLIENPSGYAHLTGLENMQIIAKLKNVPFSQIGDVLQVVDLYQQRDKKLKNYSLGMKQRLGLAMALLGNPKILILDEPTNGLDPAGIQEMRCLLKSFVTDHGMSILISSHLLGEMEQLADSVGIINHGEMVYEGPLSDLARGGQHLEDIFLNLTEQPIK